MAKIYKPISGATNTLWLSCSIIAIVIFLIFAVSPFLNLIWGPIAVNIDYSSGERSGQIIKLSEKGIIWKTWEGTMGLTQSGAYIDYWNFSVDNKDPNKEELVRQLSDFLDSGELVRIKYEQKLGSPPWRGDTSYFVKEIRTYQDAKELNY